MREERVKVGESRTLARERGIRAGVQRGKGGLHSKGRQISERLGLAKRVAKRRREPSKRRLGWRLAWWGSTEKKEASHFLGLRERHQY